MIYRFETTLYNNRGIRAHLAFRRPCKEAEAIEPYEECVLVSLGDGLDGMTGRAHGGFNSLLLDHIAGHFAQNTHPSSIAPATATTTVDFKRPVSTPGLLLARAWFIELSGRKVWIRAQLEDSDGQVCATSKTLYILAKTPKL